MFELANRTKPGAMLKASVRNLLSKRKKVYIVVSDLSEAVQSLQDYEGKCWQTATKSGFYDLNLGSLDQSCHFWALSYTDIPKPQYPFPYQKKLKEKQAKTIKKSKANSVWWNLLNPIYSIWQSKCLNYKSHYIYFNLETVADSYLFSLALQMC